MPTYISLIRGINVGGNKIVPMSELRKVLGNLGFTDVKTYIQSGNVVFRSDRKKITELETLVSEAIKARFRFDVGVLVLSLEDLDEMVRKNPFRGIALKPGERIYFTVLLQKPAREGIAELCRTKESPSPKSGRDDFEIVGKTVYVLARKSWTDSPFNSAATEKILKVSTTSRNLETMQKLLELARSLQ